MGNPQKSPQKSPQSVVVVGCCGAGKSTFSAELAFRLRVPYVERDALGKLGSDEYRAAVETMLKTDAWVFDGPPYFVDHLVYPAAQVVVCLDYSRSLVMKRAIRRSIKRTFARAEPSKNQSGRLRQWIAPGGPLFAWKTYAQRKQEFATLSEKTELSETQILRFNHPREARDWLASL